MKVAFIYIGILANSSRIQRQIKFLLNEGYDVDVYVGNENGIDQDYSNNNFTVFEYPIVHGGLYKIKSLINALYFNIKIQRKLISSGYDVIVCQELTTFLSGYLLKSRNNRIKLVYDNNELSVERYTGLKKIIWSSLQRMIIRKADVIIHAEINRMEYFVKRHNLPSSSNRLVCNYPEKKEFCVDQSARPNKLIYLGVIHPNRMLEELIQALSNSEVEFDIVGPGEPEYVNKIKEITSDIRNINVLPAVKEVMVDDLLSGYSIGLAFYSRTNLNNYYCAPNKVFQYIMNRVNIITNDYPGLKSVVEENSIGVCLSEITPTAIRAAVDSIIEKGFNKNFHDGILNSYSWESQIPEFKRIFTE